MPTVYEQLVSSLAKPGGEIMRTLTPNACHVLHMAFGIAGEAGELIDAIKKAFIYCKHIDRNNVVEELGDLEFYLEGLRQGLGITREETILANQTKLQIRYNNGSYSNAAAIERADKT